MAKLGARLQLLHCISAGHRSQPWPSRATRACSIWQFLSRLVLAQCLRYPTHHSAGRELSINADTVEGITRLAVALSLLTSYKIGRGGSWHRARQRVARILANGPQKQRDPGGRSSSLTPGPVPESKRQTFRLHVIVAGLWLALSLLLVAYATIRGEVAFAELDGLDLVSTYSLGPVAPLLDPSRD